MKNFLRPNKITILLLVIELSALGLYALIKDPVDTPALYIPALITDFLGLDFLTYVERHGRNSDCQSSFCVNYTMMYINSTVFYAVVFHLINSTIYKIFKGKRTQ